MEVTRAMLDSVARAGACKERLRKYKPGVPLSKVWREDLQWIEDTVPHLAEEVLNETEQPDNVLWGRLPLSELGSGDGYGYGYGYGDGSGDGYGSGSGSGDGSGYGYGSGYGDGYGYGYGSGSGYGDGDGDGSGDGRST